MNTVVKQQKITEFERVNSQLSHWNYDLRQIEPGPFCGSVTLFSSPGLDIFHLNANRVLQHRAKAPEDATSFYILGSDSTSLCICKQKLDAYSLALLQPGAEIKGISHPGASLYCISVKREQLEKSAELYGLQLPNLQQPSTNLSALPTYLRDLELKINRLFENPAQQSDKPLDKDSLLKNEQELLSSLLLSISPQQQREPLVSSSCKILEKSIDYINQHLESKLSIQDLCHELNVSERTVQYAFKEHFGVSPVNYLRAVRLSKTYQDLRRSTEPAMISEIARNRGFNHMSQFTADYKKHFGELPSDTLAKGS